MFGGLPTTVGAMNQQLSLFYRMAADSDYKHGRSFQYLLDDNRSNQLQQESQQAASMFGPFPDDPVLPQYVPQILGGGMGTTQWHPTVVGGNGGGEEESSFTPGFTGGVEGKNSYNGSDNGGIEMAPQASGEIAPADFNLKIGKSPGDYYGAGPFPGTYMGPPQELGNFKVAFGQDKTFKLGAAKMPGLIMGPFGEVERSQYNRINDYNVDPNAGRPSMFPLANQSAFYGLWE